MKRLDPIFDNLWITDNDKPIGEDFDPFSKGILPPWRFSTIAIDEDNPANYWTMLPPVVFQVRDKNALEE